MLEFISDDFAIIYDFSPDCESLLKMVRNASEDELIQMPGRCYTFFTRHVINGGAPNSIEDQIIVEYSHKIAEALKSAFNFDTVVSIDLPAVVYPEGCGMGLHDDLYHNSDDPEKRENVHVFSSVHYLNDDYDGGELVFPSLDLVITPKANMMLLFACHYKHEGNPATNGIKVSSTKFWRDKNVDESI
jgi:hypothetical protein|tara:strand:- start:1404 stop:1967 length:564 start_codon:yes stop_codon:yes gene_type:complete